MENEILVSLDSLKTILPVFESNILDKVKYESSKIIEPSNDDIPSIFITGTIPTSKNYINGELEYVSKTDKFHAYMYIKLQGNSTLAHPKKNFTINLYSDESRTIKLNKEFKNWGSHNNFVLKADYNDILRARNVVCAKLWGKVVKSRPDYDTLPEELRNSPNNGAIDGFPVKVYLNGDYVGLYNFTIPKCDWLFGMDNKNENHAALCAETNDNGGETLVVNPCNFNHPWSGIDGEHWSVEVGENSEALMNSFNKIHSAVMMIYEVGELGKSTLESVLDIQSAIDYFIFQDVILGIDGLAKNMMLLTYDTNKWYLSVYDMDSTFDMHWDGYLMGEPYSYMGDVPYLNKYSILLDIIWNNYWEDICLRYQELRQTVLSNASIMKEFEEYVGIYGDDLYIKDTAIYPDIPEATTNNLTYLSEFVKARLEFLDNEYGVGDLNG